MFPSRYVVLDDVFAVQVLRLGSKSMNWKLTRFFHKSQV